MAGQSLAQRLDLGFNWILSFCDQLLQFQNTLGTKARGAVHHCCNSRVVLIWGHAIQWCTGIASADCAGECFSMHSSHYLELCCFRGLFSSASYCKHFCQKCHHSLLAQDFLLLLQQLKLQNDPAGVLQRNPPTELKVLVILTILLIELIYCILYCR